MSKNEMSYELAKQAILNSKKTSLYQELKRMAENLDVLFDLIFDGLECLMEKGEPVEESKRLGGGDTSRLIKIGISLPYYLIDDKYGNVEEFIAAFSLLCANYYSAYYTDLPICAVASNLSKILEAEDAWSKLIVVSNVLTAKMEKLLDMSDAAEIGVSKQFISTMLGEHIDF